MAFPVKCLSACVDLAEVKATQHETNRVQKLVNAAIRKEMKELTIKCNLVDTLQIKVNLNIIIKMNIFGFLF
jgi:hypothetical protein